MSGFVRTADNERVIAQVREVPRAAIPAVCNADNPRIKLDAMAASSREQMHMSAWPMASRTSGRRSAMDGPADPIWPSPHRRCLRRRSRRHGLVRRGSVRPWRGDGDLVKELLPGRPPLGELGRLLPLAGG